MTVSGVILAAGRSTRLGRPKQLLLLDGEPIIRITTRHAIASRLDEVLVVVGAEAERVSSAIGNQGQRIVVNPEFALGQSTSLRAGLAALSPDSEAVVFLLGDQPEVGSQVIDALIAAFRDQGASIVQAAYGGVPANPVLFARAIFAELAEVTGDEGARSVMKRRAREIMRVDVSDGSPPGDVDTDEDYMALQERWRSAARGNGGSFAS